MYDRCIILDSSAIFHLRNITILTEFGNRIYITDKILNEIKDSRAIATVDIIRPEIITITDREIHNYKKHIKYVRDLSDADISVIICVDKIRDKCREIIVITDDMKLKSILKMKNIKVKSIFFGKET